MQCCKGQKGVLKVSRITTYANLYCQAHSRASYNLNGYSIKTNLDVMANLVVNLLITLFKYYVSVFGVGLGVWAKMLTLLTLWREKNPHIRLKSIIWLKSWICFPMKLIQKSKILYPVEKKPNIFLSYLALIIRTENQWQNIHSCLQLF